MERSRMPNSGKTLILAVDKDPLASKEAQLFLEDQGFSVLAATSADTCVSSLETIDNIKLVLLNPKLSDKIDFAIVEKIHNDFCLPIIIVSDEDNVELKIEGLEKGADDYVAKPFVKEELLARVKAALRCYNEDSIKPDNLVVNTDLPAGEKFKFANWTLDPATRMLFNSDNISVELTNSEYSLLDIFIHTPKQILPREKLFEMTHRDDYESYDRAIDTMVTRLRRKLNDTPETSNMIKTVRGVGYMFNTDVERISS